MAQQHKDSQDGFLSFSVSSLSQRPDAESSLALEGLARDRQNPVVPARTWLAQQRAPGVLTYLHPDTHIRGIPLLSPLPQIMENQL